MSNVAEAIAQLTADLEKNAKARERLARAQGMLDAEQIVRARVNKLGLHQKDEARTLRLASTDILDAVGEAIADAKAVVATVAGEVATR